MSGNPGDKPFAPTQHKLQEARKRGEVPQAQDLPMVLAALSVALALWAGSPWFARAARRLLDGLMALAMSDSEGFRHLTPAVADAAITVLLASTPLLLLAGVVGTLVKFLLVGAVFSFKPITPDLKRIDPAAGFKRLFSAPTWVQAGKSLLATTLVLGVLSPWVVSWLPELLRLWDISSILVVSLRSWLLCIQLGLFVLTVGALFDVFYQRYSFRRQMRMDLKDLKDEYKQLEGHPEQKAERRSEHRRSTSG